MRIKKQAPIEIILSPFNRFFKTSAAGGLLLMACTAAAMIWANSPFGDSYARLQDVHLTVGAGKSELSLSLLHWVNDGLMAVFFFVVGLEIKREILAGELSSARKALLPIAAAVGGMVVPAAVYLAFTWGTGNERGWGVPMATDIAFTLGVLSLLGRRIPASLKVFLTALAIADDIGAVLIIALFYGGQLNLPALALGLALLAGMAGANALGVRRTVVYFLLGAAAWLCFYNSGVHATVAGVLAAMTIPARSRMGVGEMLEKSRRLLDQLKNEHHGGNMLGSDRLHKIVLTLRKACQDAETPLQRLDARLHPWVAFAIMPVFALANGGVALSGDVLSALSSPLSLGVGLGLALGKPVGVCLATLAMIRLGLSPKLPGVTSRHLLGAGCLAGIGFTMSIFVAGLAFPGPQQTDLAKLGILSGSLISALAGWAVLRGLPEIADES
ncbi:MAG: Na+/H+ antiporter NhaA [Humidesulfovibrio sp.]|uniref:Na+/H+ antiporter NhaA n=1 Tax=Humidesulfovibrio sp. TaxID=2910988 RepID=UPI00273688DE|nr:Na+/H+ antiporter NhaA [Humidesulfovibrio sp.]MDP2848913.1 Na+/H+ antiporter NhaA [Humidesulfovibrio sp.]